MRSLYTEQIRAAQIRFRSVENCVLRSVRVGKNNPLEHEQTLEGLACKQTTLKTGVFHLNVSSECRGFTLIGGKVVEVSL